MQPRRYKIMTGVEIDFAREKVTMMISWFHSTGCFSTCLWWLSKIFSSKNVFHTIWNQTLSGRISFYLGYSSRFYVNFDFSFLCPLWYYMACHFSFSQYAFPAFLQRLMYWRYIHAYSKMLLFIAWRVHISIIISHLLHGCTHNPLKGCARRAHATAQPAPAQLSCDAGQIEKCA